MTILFLILIIIACIVLSLVVLVQNPKGGGLASNVGGFSNQFMGVKQTTDVLEKGTWVFAALIAILCIASTFFISGGEAVNDRLNNVGTTPIPAQRPAAAPQNTTTLPGTGITTPPAGDTSK